MKQQFSLLALSTLVLAAIFIAPVDALAQQTPQYPGSHMGYGWHGWYFGPIMMIVFISLAVVVVATLLRWLGGQSHSPPPYAPPMKSPLDILKERFARGEIDKEEYEERRRLLE
jgi:putative membrane protein